MNAIRTTSSCCCRARDTGNAPLTGPAIGKRKKIKSDSTAGAREDFAKLLKLAEQNPTYKPVVYLWWSFLGPDLGGITEAERKFYYEKAIELGPANAAAL